MSDTGFDRQGITAGTELILSLPAPLQPAPLFTPTPKAARRVLEFFTAQINNPHTRRAYLSAARRFAAWCEARGIAQLTDVQAFHVAAFIKDLQGEFSPPTVVVTHAEGAQGASYRLGRSDGQHDHQGRDLRLRLDRLRWHLLSYCFICFPQGSGNLAIQVCQAALQSGGRSDNDIFGRSPSGVCASSAAR